jgi:hypothetical protein
VDLSKTTFVLGGPDTEMKYITDILEDRGLKFTYASDSLGNRVSRKAAYDVDIPKLSRNQVWIECRPRGYGSNEMQSLGYCLIDHHNEGDPGYNASPKHFWEASSIGQLCSLIGQPKTIELQMIAAADHCLHHAYNDGCPPIKRAQLLDFRLSHYKEGIQLAKVRFQQLLDHMRENRTYEFNGTLYFDASDVKRNSFFVTDASAYGNIPFISIRQRFGSESKKVFLGNAPGKDITFFLEEGCHQFGEVQKVFGDPRRQFAGAYLEKDVYDED